MSADGSQKAGHLWQSAIGIVWQESCDRGRGGFKRDRGRAASSDRYAFCQHFPQQKSGRFRIRLQQRSGELSHARERFSSTRVCVYAAYSHATGGAPSRTSSTPLHPRRCDSKCTSPPFPQKQCPLLREVPPNSRLPAATHIARLIDSCTCAPYSLPDHLWKGILD